MCGVCVCVRSAFLEWSPRPFLVQNTRSQKNSISRFIPTSSMMLVTAAADPQNLCAFLQIHRAQISASLKRNQIFSARDANVRTVLTFEEGHLDPLETDTSGLRTQTYKEFRFLCL